MCLMIDRLGVLRISYRREVDGQWKTCWLPLAAVERFAGRPLFLSKMPAAVRLTAGVTVASIFEALSPWAEIVGNMLQIDFQAWKAAMRKPIAVDAMCDFDFIAIRPCMSFEAHAILTREEIDLSWECLERGESPPPGQPSDTITVSVTWDACGRKTGAGENYSLCDGGVQGLGGVPVQLLTHAVVNDATNVTPGALSHPRPLFDPANPFVRSQTVGRGGRLLEMTAEIAAPLDQAVIRGLVGELCSATTPEKAAEHWRQTAAAIKRNAAWAEADVESKKRGVGEAATEPVPTPDKAAAGGEPRRRKVIFAPGAFDEVTRHYEAESRFAAGVLNSLDPIERRAVVEEDDE